VKVTQCRGSIARVVTVNVQVASRTTANVTRYKAFGVH